MTRHAWVFRILASCTLVLGSCGPAQIAPPPPGHRVAHLIERLGAVGIGDREIAQRDLVDIGDAALEALEEAMKDDDVDVAARATEARRRILAKWRLEHLRLVLQIDKTAFPSGELISVRPVLINDHDQPVTIIVRDLHIPGAHESLTHWSWSQGNSLNATYPACGCPGREALRVGDFAVLRPGGEHFFPSYVFDTAEMKPGKVTLRGTYDARKPDALGVTFLPNERVRNLWHAAVAAEKSETIEVEIIGKK